MCVCAVYICVCWWCVCVGGGTHLCWTGGVSWSGSQGTTRPHWSLPSLALLFSPDEEWSMSPYCVENTFSKEKIWFWKKTTPFGQPVQTLCEFKWGGKKNPKSDQTGKVVWHFHKVLEECIHSKNLYSDAQNNDQVPHNPCCSKKRSSFIKNRMPDCTRRTLNSFK